MRQECHSIICDFSHGQIKLISVTEFGVLFYQYPEAQCVCVCVLVPVSESTHIKVRDEHQVSSLASFHVAF